MNLTRERILVFVLFTLLIIVIFLLSSLIFIQVREPQHINQCVIEENRDFEKVDFSAEEKEVIEKIYGITKNPEIYDPEELKKIRVPSGSNMIYDVYKWIAELQEKDPDHNGEYLSGELKTAVADLLWFFQERDINDPILGDCNVNGMNDDWHTNLWAGYYQHFVPTVGCDTVYRAGLMGDGGKHLCNVHKIMKSNLENDKKCMVYSMGTFNDISFDNQMHYLLGCSAHAFDPTIKDYQLRTQLNDHVKFHQYGIGPGIYDPWELEGNPLKTLTQISEELGTKTVDIFKIDVEGAEIPVFDHIFNEEKGILDKLGVKIILVEYHHPSALDKDISYDCKDRKKHLYPFIKSFYDNGYYMFRFEHNVYGVACIEYGFISKDMI